MGKIIVATSFEWLLKVQKIAQSGHTGDDDDDSAKRTFLERRTLGGGPRCTRVGPGVQLW